MSFHIEKNTVQETLVIPLLGRLVCDERFPELFSDPEAKRICAMLDYDFTEKRKRMESPAGLFGALEVAQRQYDLRREVEEYLKEHPNAAVVNLGCGLDDTFSKVDNGSCRGCHLDLPDVIAVRNELLPAGEREQNIACDLNEFVWMDRIDAGDGAVFFAAGVFYYFKAEDIKALFSAMAERFPGSVLVFDSCNRRGARLMQKTWLREAGITNVNATFSLEDPDELKRWGYTCVSSKSYMRGYRDIYRDVGLFHKLMILFCDHLVNMRIDKTGTLTRACPTLVSVEAFNAQKESEMLRIAACMEEHFPHSVANAVVRAAKERHLDHEEMHSEVEYVVAHGIATKINGRRTVIGSSHFVFEDENTAVRPEDRARFDALPDELSWLYLSLGGVLSAAIGISDPLRPEAGETITALHRAGMQQIVMLTGDNRRTAAAIAGQLGLDVYLAQVLPEDKAAYIAGQKAAGCGVVMIGDGINDTPALSLADVGIAMGSGAVIAREVADITIAADNLMELVYLRQLSRRLMRRIHWNYRFLIGFNGSLILLGALGLLPPALSALLHNTSTLLLSLHSMTGLMDNPLVP